MKDAIALILIVYCCTSCNPGSSHNTGSGSQSESMKMILSAEDSLRKIDEMMGDTGMPMNHKMDMMYRKTEVMEKNTGMLMNDSMMWMDSDMKRVNDSLKMLDTKMSTGKMDDRKAMEMMKEKTALLQKQWQKTKAMKQEMEEMKQIGSDKMNRKNR